MIANFIDKTVAKVDDFDIHGNIVTLVGDIPQNTSGFYLSRDNYNDDWDYTAFKTVYRVLENGVQFSNDGTKWSDQTIDITVSALWDDEDDKEKYRPGEILVLVDGVGVILNSSNNWHKTYKDMPITSKLEVVFPDVEGYELYTQGNNATYKHDCIPTPTLEERLDDVESAVLELYEIVEV